MVNQSILLYFIVAACAGRALCVDPVEASTPPSMTNGKFVEHTMMYFDSVQFLVAIDLGVPQYFRSLSNKKGGGDDAAEEEAAAVTPSQLAEQFDLSVRAASAMLVTLCRLDVVSVHQDNEISVDDVSYVLTPEAQLFLSDPDSPSYTGHFIKTLTDNFATPQSLLDVSRKVETKDLMSESLEESEEEQLNNARHFMRHMNSQSASTAQMFPHVIGLDGRSGKSTTMLDVGGGSGIYTIETAKADDNVRGVILELANIVPLTQEFVADANMSDRIEVVPGDFFTDAPFPSADLVLFANILHDWPDEQNIKLLNHAYDCLSPGGRIAISEFLLADDIASSSQASTSMNVIMIPWTKGRQYRPKELVRRLIDAGFVQPSVSVLADDVSVVVAVKPSADNIEL